MHVITAAHCVHVKSETESRKKSPEDILVLLGTHNLSSAIANEENIVEADHITIHSDYSATDKRFTGDIAMITLMRKVTFTDYIQPICVFDNDQKYANIDRGVVAGWGKTLNTNSHSDIPFSIVIPIVENESCYRSEHKLATFAWDKSFCAGSEGTSACQGDSGSGFYVRIGDRFFLKGLVSSAINGGGCTGDHLVIFTDMLKYQLSGQYIVL